MWHNPPVFTDLGGLTPTEIMWAQYQFQVASTMLFFALLIFYFLFKIAVWVLPKFWQKEDLK